ncbi:MAG: long-chain fatty acid--CoA ligase [Chloroflexi bacterium]|nr:MAG: long-chain fatty acid--CoA ligase [Anaerolineaceae bacterium 4572_32.2]RLC75794.1 MAG: long-chain fatty acid--CoA ligase [Chloroflexota bacterium]RLC84310.1 MAG: long-chain fatty acid--CoA ligase [Chloroflexota bacterium]HEY72059.1 long-chain fatty acid--CoA ligase [Thermoflexia bacterium]
MEKPWLKFYESHVPEHVDYPETPMPAVLEETARKYPGHTATIFKDAKLTFREINQAVDRFAAALQELGVKKGDRVAVHLLNMPQFPIAYNAILRVGGIVVPCNPIYTAREMKHQVSDSGAKVIITLSLMYPIIKQIRAETQLEHVIVAKIKTYFPPFLNLLFTLLKEKKGGHRVDISGDANTYWFKDLLDNAPAKPTPVEIDMDDTAVFMYTGGTTGVSKGAQLTHKNILANAYQCKVWMNAEEAQGDVSVTALPLYHSYAMTTCMNFSTIIAGALLLIPDPRDLEDVLKSITKHQPTFYAGVPAMYVAINNYPDLSKYDVSSIRACISGAAGLPVEVQQRFQELTGARLVEGYGLSEASPVTHANPMFGDNRVGTIGVPWPDTEIKIMDADTGEKELGVGEAGELCIRGPQVMKGYWNMPTETANTLRDHADGGGPWLHTGDVAVMDEDGYFKIVDRKKDMILGAGGYNIYPREVEEVLYEHPKVLEVAAAGVPVPGKGERVKIYVVLKEGQTATEEEFIEFCKENLAPYKVPKFVEFRDELPKTMVGKILRRVLVEEEKKKLAE